MAAEDGQERTERATSKRLREAREKGQVPRSRELTTMAMMMASAALLLFMGDGMVARLAERLRSDLRIDRARIFDPTAMLRGLGESLADVLLMLAPFFGLLIVVALMAPIALGGWNFSTEALTPKFEKLDPIKGLGKVFSARGLVELVKALAKFFLIATVAVAMLYQMAGQYMSLANQSLLPAMNHAAHLLGWSFLILSASLILIAAVDVPFQLWDHQRQLRMSRQEVKDEFKETEGHPEVKGRLRAMQRELAQRRMMEEVPKADVVVTNPTHFAVALRYDQNKMSAPKVVAKGTELVAGQIRHIAAMNGVTVVSAPPLARALYYSTEIGHDIPGGLYVAVAQVLAYVFHLKTARRDGGLEPALPTDLPVPDEFLRRDRNNGGPAGQSQNVNEP